MDEVETWVEDSEVYEIIDFSYFYFKELTLSNVLNLLIFNTSVPESKMF